MMARTAAPARVVALRGALLLAVAGDDGGVQIERDLLQSGDLAEEPAIALRLHTLVGEDIEAVEKAHQRLVAGRSGPAEQAGERCVHAHRLGMHEAAGAASDRHDELLDQLERFVAPIRSRPRQLPALHRLPKLHAVEHALQQRSPPQAVTSRSAKLTENPSPASVCIAFMSCIQPLPPDFF
jgi:hypothetical protein